MKIMSIKVCGASYPVCFNARVMSAGEEKYGNMTKFTEAIFGEEIAFKDFIWFLAAMLDAGYRASKRQGIESEVPPSEEDLLDMIGLSDIYPLRQSMMSVSERDTERKVEVDEPKNAQTIQQQA